MRIRARKDKKIDIIDKDEVADMEATNNDA